MYQTKGNSARDCRNIDNTTTNKYLYNGKELQDEQLGGYHAWPLNLYDFEARFYSYSLSRFMQPDPLAEKRFSISPYAYCSNNPINKIDPTGKLDTDYRNEKGELLYKTDDGLINIVVIPDKKIDEFENKLNELYENEKLNNAEANKEELHTMGVQLESLKDDIMTKDASLDVGIARGYDEGYNDKKTSTVVKVLRFIAGAEDENSKINSGHVSGKKLGLYDREHGKINKLDAYPSLKRNEPLLKVPKLEPIKRYPGKGLPPM